MKFRTNDGEILAKLTPKKCYYRFECNDCPIGALKNPYGESCATFIKDHQKEAALLLGMEVVDDDGCNPEWSDAGKRFYKDLLSPLGPDVSDPRDRGGESEPVNSIEIEAIEMEKAHWIDNGDSYVCSACGFEIDSPNRQECGAGKCSNCGATMITKESSIEKKPLGKLTLEEIQAWCRGHDDCPGCPCYTKEKGCLFAICAEAAEWPLDAGQEDHPVAEDKNVPGKPAKPMIAEILGVEVGEKFRVNMFNTKSGDFHIDEGGNFLLGKSSGYGDVLCWAINHPESIVRRHVLTEDELTICKAARAKYVTRDPGNVIKKVALWDGQPAHFNGDSRFSFVETPTAHHIASFYEGFDGVLNGECVSVEEVSKK